MPGSPAPPVHVSIPSRGSKMANVADQIECIFPSISSTPPSCVSVESEVAHRSISRVFNVDTMTRRPLWKGSSWDSVSSTHRRDLALRKSKDLQPDVARSEGTFGQTFLHRKSRFANIEIQKIYKGADCR